MRHFRRACLMFAITACAPAEPMPKVADVDRLEAQLAGRPCIGSLDQWSRRYTFGHGGDQRSPDGDVDRNRIVFKLDQAGIYHYRAGRTILVLIDGLDERPRRQAYGEYDVPSGRLTVLGCE